MTSFETVLKRFTGTVEWVVAFVLCILLAWVLSVMPTPVQP